MVQSKAFFEKMLADLQTQLKNANINFEESPQGSIVPVSYTHLESTSFFVCWEMVA